jgi:hypothetical protein
MPAAINRRFEKPQFWLKDSIALFSKGEPDRIDNLKEGIFIAFSSL